VALPSALDSGDHNTDIPLQCGLSVLEGKLTLKIYKYHAHTMNINTEYLCSAKS
jgi:hypothetical protein